MARDFSEVLQQAMEFYVAGQLVEARALLFDVVRADPTVEAGWMFLSYTLADPAQKADCLRKVLALNPNNAEARATLAKLFPEQPKQPDPAAPLVHASPFTVDIDHANDEIASPARETQPSASGPAPAAPSAPPLPRAAAPIRPSPAAPPPFPPAEEDEPAADSTPTVRTVSPRAATPPPAAGSPAPAAAVKAEPPISKTEEKKASGAAVQPAKPAASVVPAKRTGAPAAPPPADAKVPKKRGTGCTCAIVALVILLIGAGIGGTLWATGNLPGLPLPAAPTANPAATPADTPTPYQLQLPPESTDTPVPTQTPTRTISPTPTMSLTPSLAPPDATVEADIQRLKQEVADLRGLTMDEDLPVYVVDKSQAETILQAELDRTNYRETIQSEARSLAALGFIKPTYDLAKYALSRLADGVLGFYLPSARTIFIIGNRFAGMERWTFTHEYDHALVHHYYPAVGIMEDDPLCANDSQRCEAIRALVEGDATLLMVQWYNQYASPYDKRDIAYSPYPFGLPPEQNTPPYVAPSVEFAYSQGYAFVGSLWQLGNWERVNRVYEDLPVSTEQILHPEKYLAGEKPVAMKIPNLVAAVGGGWTLIDSDTLGEFMTYLLLAYGADLQAELPTETAKNAAAGWGGDHYLVLSNADGTQVILAAEWTWDTTNDAGEFQTSMLTYLDKRFRGNKAESASGKCWSVNEQTTCAFLAGRNLLWIMAPSMDLIDSVRSAYAGF